MDTVGIVDKIKVLLGIKDTLQDDVLTTIVDTTSSRLSLLIGEATVPASLGYIATEVSIVRFNRLGSEGYASDSLEGHSITFKDNDFSGYMIDLDKYSQDTKRSNAKGKVHLL